MQKDKQDALTAKKRGLDKKDDAKGISQIKSLKGLNSKNELSTDVNGTVSFGPSLLEKQIEENQKNFSRRL